MAHKTPTSGCKKVSDDKVVTKLNNTIDIPRNGYLYIYTSNETKNIDVYFDNLQLSHTRSSLLEGNNYYAFGGDIKALCSKAMKGLAYVNNNYKFNSGTEFNDDLDIALYETPFRNYNAQIGRFYGLDKLSELNPSLTPNHFGYNNPISFNDPSGLDPDDLDPVTVTGTIHKEFRYSYVFLEGIGGSSFGGGWGLVGGWGGGSSGSSSEPDGWVRNADGSAHYVKDPNVGEKQMEYIDPTTGNLMMGLEDGTSISYLGDVMVVGTRHSNNFLNWPSIRPGQSFWSMEMQARIRDG